MRHPLAAAAAICLLALTAAPLQAAPARTGADYVFAGDMHLGGPGFWDYVSFEAGRLYVGHVERCLLAESQGSGGAKPDLNVLGWQPRRGRAESRR